MAGNRIDIMPHQTRWADEFSAVGATIRDLLGSLALRIDHIGSTAVPGLPAKDCVDVQVTVAALAETEPLALALARAGFRATAIARDHRPLGNDLPAEHWQKRYFREPEESRRIHVHVREQGRANQRYALLFRDFLRAMPDVAASYGQTKRELARLHPEDADAYYAVKDPICDLIMAGAELWATTTRWQAGPSDA